MDDINNNNNNNSNNNNNNNNNNSNSNNNNNNSRKTSYRKRFYKFICNIDYLHLINKNNKILLL